VRVLALDLTDADDLAHYSALLEEEQPDVRVLVNASGRGKFGAAGSFPTEDALGMIDLNCRALVAMTEWTMPYLSAGSRVLEISSIASFQPVPCLAAYAATKAFVTSYARALNRELRRRGVTVTAVCPGWMKTEFIACAAQRDDPVVTYYDCFHEPRDVAAKALADSARGRDISVHGLRAKAQQVLVKVLPHRLAMRVWERQQKFS
jgi:hypothetical protein